MKLIDSEKRFLLPQGHTLFNNCHASSITTLPGGELLTAFFAGLREGERDVGIWLSRTENGIWQMPVRLLAEDGLACWNPVLHGAGDKVWLFYKVGASVHTWVTRWTVSSDLGRNWALPLALVPGDTLPRGPVRNKLIVLSNGEWIAPGSLETEAVWATRSLASLTPAEACAILPATSLVTAACSSMAVAMPATRCPTSAMTPVIF